MEEAFAGEKKKLLLMNLQNFAKGGKNSLLRQALQAFSENAKHLKTVRAINLRLLKTVQGQYFESFLKWKTIPQAKGGDYAKASKFDRALSKVVRRIVKRTTWDPLYDVHDDA